MSSSSTTGNSGAFAWRTKATQDCPFVRTRLLSLTAVRSENDSSTMAMTRTPIGIQKFVISCGCLILSMPS